MKKRSPIRQFIRAVRFIIGVSILVCIFTGNLYWPIGLLSYALLWLAFILIDAPLKYQEDKNRPKLFVYRGKLYRSGIDKPTPWMLDDSITIAYPLTEEAQKNGTPLRQRIS